jgi:hypothetical protein
MVCARSACYLVTLTNRNTLFALETEIEVIDYPAIADTP